MKAMTIGLPQFRDRKTNLRFDRMLLQPFRRAHREGQQA